MNNETRAEIERRNGGKSRGPVTVEGRRRASLNALKHGLSAREPRTLCLSNEDQSCLDRLVARWIAKLQPRDEAELEMVHEIVAHRWRLQRSWTIETATLDAEMDVQSAALDRQHRRFDEPVRLAKAFQSLSDKSSSLDVLGRYEYRIRRQFERALTDYLRLRELIVESIEEELPEPGPLLLERVA